MDIHVKNYKRATDKSMKGTRIGLICPTHGYIQGDHCPECRKSVGSGVNIQVFKPMVYEDICETPLLISSKRQLKEECKKHDVTACRLL